MKAVILARVSSKEQEEGLSLDAQVERLTEFARRKNLEVIKTFQIVESSTHGNRKKFLEVLRFCKLQKEKIAVVADAVDRIQRSFNDSILLNDLMQKGVIELHFWRENMVLGEGATSTDIMRWDFAVMAAKSYVLQLSENVKRSISYKIQNGELSGRAPIGYKNIRDERGKSHIIIDELNGAKIKQLFEAYSFGHSSFKELALKANKIGVKTLSGKPVSVAFLHKTICNPFYYGQMLIKGRLYPHKYEPLITKELWDACQAVRKGTGKKPWKYSDKPFLYRGLIKCANTGKTCTTYTAKGKYNYIIYYGKDGARHEVREEVIEAKVVEILDTIKIPTNIIEAMEKHLGKVKSEEREYHEAETRQIKRELEQTETRINNLFELYVDKKVDEDMYQEKMPELKCKRQELIIRLSEHAKADDSFNDTVFSLFQIANRVGEFFRKSSNLEHKRAILKAVIRTLEIKDGKLGYSLHFPFCDMQEIPKNKLWRPRRDLAAPIWFVFAKAKSAYLRPPTNCD